MKHLSKGYPCSQSYRTFVFGVGILVLILFLFFTRTLFESEDSQLKEPREKNFQPDLAQLDSEIKKGEFEISTVGVQPDLAVIVGGVLYNGRDEDFAILKYKVNDKPDDFFGLQGVTITDFEGSDDQPRSIFFQPDGKILIGGQSCRGNGLCVLVGARYLRSGQIDTSFGKGGKLVTNISSMGEPNSVSMTSTQSGLLIIRGRFCKSQHRSCEVESAIYAKDGAFIKSRTRISGKRNDVL